MQFIDNCSAAHHSKMSLHGTDCVHLRHFFTFIVPGALAAQSSIQHSRPSSGSSTMLYCSCLQHLQDTEFTSKLVFNHFCSRLCLSIYSSVVCSMQDDSLLLAIPYTYLRHIFHCDAQVWNGTHLQEGHLRAVFVSLPPDILHNANQHDI